MQTKFVNAVLFIMVTFSFITLAGCKKEKQNPQEVITTIVLRLTGSGGFDQEFVWEDKESDGNPTIDDIVLPAGGTFTGTISFFDRSGTNNEDITEEVAEESNDHLVVYSLTGADGTITISDTDANGKPLGLTTSWISGGVSTGNLQIKLLHTPDKNAADPTTTGDIDVEVVFPVAIQ